MESRIRWTNPSVLKLAGGDDPLEVMGRYVRSAVLKAKDQGWSGPPYDPVELARLLGIRVDARSDIPDARTIALADGPLAIEFNPLRPRARVRFSVAHEIAHSFFPDCSEAIRNRGGNPSGERDDWQLEVLCNIAAAELLMPAGSFTTLDDSDLSINTLLTLRKRYDVSTEALLIRVVKLASNPCAVFCASSHDGQYQIDYVIPSRSWAPGISAGKQLPVDSVIREANAIGFTTIGTEPWNDDGPIHIECVALPPYPGSTIPRVVGILSPISSEKSSPPTLIELIGDALDPRGHGPHIIAHVVPDSSLAWGGKGFAGTVKQRFPHVWHDFRNQALAHGTPLQLGSSFITRPDSDLSFFHMVAQRGYGPSSSPRIRYTALETCLQQLADNAKEQNAAIQMPRIGTGYAGGDWEVISELINDIIVSQGIKVTVFSLS